MKTFYEVLYSVLKIIFVLGELFLFNNFIYCLWAKKANPMENYYPMTFYFPLIMLVAAILFLIFRKILKPKTD